MTGRPRSRSRTRPWPLPVVMVSTVLLTLSSGSVAILLGPYLRSRGLEAGLIGFLVGASGLAALLVRIPSGIGYRAHRALPMLAAGAAVSATSFLLLPSVGHPAALAGLIALDGAGFALASTTAMATVVDRRPAAVSMASLLGWFTGSIGVGYSLAGFLGGSLSDAIGIPAAIRAMAFGPPLVVLGMGLALRRLHPESPDAGVPAWQGARTWFRTLPAGVWVAFLIALHINLVNGALHAFLPLYGLSIGMTLTQVGALSGIHGSLASVVRFGSGALFRRVPYRRLLVALVLASGAFISLVAVPTGFVFLALAVAALGVTRGILRVASGALAVEEAGPSGRERGGASGLYLAGLDLGNMLGPVVGGVAAEAFGLRGVFPVVGVAFPAVYLALSAALARRRAAAGAEQAQPILTP